MDAGELADLATEDEDKSDEDDEDSLLPTNELAELWLLANEGAELPPDPPQALNNSVKEKGIVKYNNFIMDSTCKGASPIK